MRKYILLLMMLMATMPQYAQTRHRSGSRHQRTTVSQQRKGGKKGTQTTSTQKGGKGKATYTTSEIRGLQSQRKQIEQDIRAQQNRLFTLIPLLELFHQRRTCPQIALA